MLLSKHPLYNVWASMRDRCRNPKNRAWNRYGGRGIDVCPQWETFSQFLADMGERPPKTSLDRIDNDKGYSPENCRWATRQDQAMNRSRAVYVEIGGTKHRAIELAKASGHKVDTIIKRARKGLPLEEVVSPESHVDLSGLALGGAAAGAKKRAKTHCPHGHSYENAIVSKEGFRRCRTCWHEKERNRLAKKKVTSF